MKKGLTSRRPFSSYKGALLKSPVKKTVTKCGGRRRRRRSMKSLKPSHEMSFPLLKATECLKLSS